MAERKLHLKVKDLLYRTRGRDWDYAFLLQPAPLLSEGWYTIHRRIFANVEPTPEPLLLRGTLAIGQGHPFFASAFTDQERRDHQGRPVAHYLVWFARAGDPSPDGDFGAPLLTALSAALAAVFELVPQQLLRGQTAALDSLLRDRFAQALGSSELTLALRDRSEARWLGTVAL